MEMSLFNCRKPEHTRDTWLKSLEGKIDEESLAAKCRLQSCSDLPAVDARYHIKCKNKLNVASVRSPPNSANRGRPRNQLIEVNYDRLCSWLEREGKLYTVNELFDKMKQLSDDPSDPNGVYSRPYRLKNALEKKYGKDIYF